ncbi:hypothetical protein O3Q51_00315 [Cryomorphaceae bacterium 1068]|nr:hypothetical protein [Cryomorphaceae bacterium 1068]
MKTIIITALAILAFGYSKAQETEVIYTDAKKPREVETLMKSDGGFGGHLSLNVKGTEVTDQAAVMVGGELVFTLNHALNIGVAGYGMPTRIDYDDKDNFYRDNLSVEFGYGGFFIEPVFFDQKVVHFSVPVLIGGGWAGLSNLTDAYDRSYPNDVYLVDESIFFVLEPGINMEVNLVKYVKLTLGGSYRYVSGSDLRNIEDSDLSGLSFGAGIRVGWF